MAPALRWTGLAIAAAQVVAAVFLLAIGAERYLAIGNEALCWPMFPSCSTWRHFSATTWRAVFAVYGVLGAWCAVFFALRRSWAKWLLLAAHLVLLLIVVQDYRLRLNQFYMLSFVVAAFVFLPDTQRVVRLLVMLFYFWAGTLKLNPDWLTGAAILRPTFLGTGVLLQAACGYAAVLELVLVWGLLARRPWVFWATYAQLLAFTAFSATQVGFFYPTLMLCLTSVFVIDRLWPTQEAPRRSTWFALAVFSSLQLIPRVIPGDSALTGEGRLFALHMLDAHVICQAELTAHRDGVQVAANDLRRGLPPRTMCEPAMVLARTRWLCGANTDPGLRFNLRLRSRRATAQALHDVVAIDDVCNDLPHYDVLGRNAWINPVE